MSEQNYGDHYQNEKLKKFVQLLYGVLFFNIFSVEELSAIISEDRLIKWKKFDPGKAVFAQGVFDQHFYVIIQGSVELRKKRDDTEITVGVLHKGDVFGELVVCDPGQPRRASAYVSGAGTAILCEFDGTLITTVPEVMQAKFYKKFLDLVVNRLEDEKSRQVYYEELIAYVHNNNISASDDYFSYTLETAVSDRNRLTQFIKYSDYLVSKKIPADAAIGMLQKLLKQATAQLSRSFERL